MANYPDLSIDARSYRISVSDGSESSRADSGALRIRRLWDGLRFSIVMDHPNLEWADFLSLLNFYMTNRTDDQIAFVDPLSEQQYLVSILAPPTHTQMFGSRLYVARVELEGVLSGNT